MLRRMFIKVFILIGLIHLRRTSSSDADSIGLLMGTLRLMRKAACDNEVVSLSCPQGLYISIQVAQYGKKPDGHTCQQHRSLNPLGALDMNGNECLWPNNMQYSLLQTVIEACQRKAQCKFSTKPKSVVEDPCPNARKFVEIAYKCRPYEFRSKIGCENEYITLNCNPNSRIAIFDANYGRTAFDSIQCPQNTGVNTHSCLAYTATKKVMVLCHGKRSCRVPANKSTFGSPCKPESKDYLKIVYTCVPRGILSDQYETMNYPDEVRRVDELDDSRSYDESDIREYGTHITQPPALPALPEDAKAPLEKSSILNLTNTNATITNGSESTHTVIIYAGVGVFLFLVLLLLLVAVRCYISRRDARKSKASDMYTTDMPNVFTDNVSDIDNDIDIKHISGTFYDPLQPDMILYRDSSDSKNTMKAVRPLSTIYPSSGVSMYGVGDSIKYTTTTSSRFRREDKVDTGIDPEILVSPKVLERRYDSYCYYD